MGGDPPQITAHLVSEDGRYAVQLHRHTDPRNLAERESERKKVRRKYRPHQSALRHSGDPLETGQSYGFALFLGAFLSILTEYGIHPLYSCMPKTSFILGVALLVVATTLAITITIRPRATQAREGPSAGPTAAEQALHRPGRSTATPQDARIPPKRRHPSIRESFSVEAPLDHPQRAELAEAAHAVEREARLQLDKLTKQLDLSGYQREQLFPLLVQGSRNYRPELVISGASREMPRLTGGARDEEIAKVLDDEQLDQQLENAVDDLLLWQEIIANLQTRLETETPQLKEDPPVPPSNRSTPGRRGNLKELLEK